ncbi:hypothetical protein HaLaN_28305, partial [Haematococcus lacustris]
MLEEMEAQASRLAGELDAVGDGAPGAGQKALQAERPDLLDLLRTHLLPVKVQQLVGLLANLFPCLAGGLDQQERVAPHHKSVLAWLTSAAGMSAAQFHVGTHQLHRLLARSCLQQGVQCVADGQADSPLACTRQGAGLGCSLRHAVAHACLSGEGEVLQTLVLELGVEPSHQQLHSILVGNTPHVTSVALSPDGKALASGSQNAII